MTDCEITPKNITVTKVCDIPTDIEGMTKTAQYTATGTCNRADCPMEGQLFCNDIRDATNDLAKQQAYNTFNGWCTIKELGL